MIATKIFWAENRLAKILPKVGGAAFEDLVAASEARVALLADKIREHVSAQVAQIVKIHDMGEEEMFAQCIEIGDAAMNIAETAGAAELQPVGEAARGIRAMVDSLVSSGVWHSDALALHITSLALLNGPTPPSAKETKAILKRLHDLRAAIGVAE